MPELTYENKRSLIQSAIKSLYPGDVYPWVEDMMDSKIVYNVSGKSYQASYSIDKDGGVKLGTPTEVVRQTVYKGVTSIHKGVRIGK